MSILSDKIKNYMEQQVKKEETIYILFDKLLSLLEKFEDKKITKRMESELQKHFPTAKVRIDRKANWWSLMITGKVNDKEFVYNEFDALLSYSDIYQKDNFIEKNQRYYSAAKDRIISRKKELEHLNLQTIVDDYAEATQAVQKLEDDLSLFTDKYGIKELFINETGRFPKFE